MATIKSALSDDVVRNANIIETMAAGIVGGIATPMIRAVIPASIPYSGLVADGIQIVGGVMAGKAVGVILVNVHAIAETEVFTLNTVIRQLRLRLNKPGLIRTQSKLFTDFC